jgi:hypothetical protein
VRGLLTSYPAKGQLLGQVQGLLMICQDKVQLLVQVQDRLTIYQGKDQLLVRVRDRLRIFPVKAQLPGREANVLRKALPDKIPQVLAQVASEHRRVLQEQGGQTYLRLRTSKAACRLALLQDLNQ